MEKRELYFYCFIATPNYIPTAQVEKICYVLCILMVAFISGCNVNNNSTVNHDFGVIFDESELSGEENGHKEDTLLDIHSETDVSEDGKVSTGESQQDIKIMDSVEENMLLYGDCGGNLGFGWLLYTVPNQESQDYKIYFFADQKGTRMRDISLLKK